jgi:hypothetical protein
MIIRAVTGAMVLVLCGYATGRSQAVELKSSEIAPFMGTWPLAMTNPAGALETVRIWDEKGVVEATVQSGRFPPIKVTGMLKDGEMLVLTLSRFENGKADRGVIALTLDGETMKMAQMLEFSQTIKRGSGRKASESISR